MKFLISLLLIFILLFTPNCQKEKDHSSLGVPDGFIDAYLLYVTLALYGRLPNCPRITGTIQPNNILSGNKSINNILLSEFNINDKLVARCVSSDALVAINKINEVYLSFVSCDALGYRTDQVFNIECSNDNENYLNFSSAEGYCIAKSNYKSIIAKISCSYTGDGNDYILEFKR